MLGESAVKMSNEVDGQREEARPFVNTLDWGKPEPYRWHTYDAAKYLAVGIH